MFGVEFFKHFLPEKYIACFCGSTKIVQSVSAIAQGSGT